MENNSKRVYKDKVAIITGAASGIGFALSRELSLNGCEVVLADVQGDKAEKAAQEIRNQDGKAGSVELDVRNFSAFEELVQETVSRTGHLDYLFNNAGIGVGGHTHEYAVETWDRAIDINLRGVIYGVQAAYPVMHNQGFGHIVNIASMAGLVSNGGMAAYCATKHGVVGLSKSLRAEAKQYGVRVSVVCPGVIRTDIMSGGRYGKLHGISPEEMKAIFELGSPMDVDIFAKEVLKDVAKNSAIIILPRFLRLMWWLTRLMPPGFEIRSARKNSILEGKKRLEESTR